VIFPFLTSYTITVLYTIKSCKARLYTADTFVTYLLTLSLSPLPALNLGKLEAGISITAPVLGFLPLPTGLSTQ